MDGWSCLKKSDGQLQYDDVLEPYAVLISLTL